MARVPCSISCDPAAGVACSAAAIERRARAPCWSAVRSAIRVRCRGRDVARSIWSAISMAEAIDHIRCARPQIVLDEAALAAIASAASGP